MLVCGDGEPAPPDAPPIVEGVIERWIDLCGPSRIYGEQLDEPATAQTVRVADGQVLVCDGPFLEAKEFIAGFDLLECDDLDRAVTLAAAHPVAARGLLELRPFSDGASFTGVGEALSAAQTAPGRRFMAMFTVDGVAEPDAVEAQIRADGRTWGEQLSAAGSMLFGYSLLGAETATTVRVRGGQTLLSDGPFAESKEFLAGLALLSCGDIDEAVALAARHPLAAFHPVEVRPFMVWGQ